jgi:three-Cys-motif partner protein
MSNKPIKVDPSDGLIVDEVGSWASEKHDRLKRYISISKGPRAKFLPPNNAGGAGYIELFSGPGRSMIRDTNRIIDGSPIAAYRAAHSSGSRFSDLHFGDIDADNCAALTTRIKAIGGAANSYVGAADNTVDQVVSSLNPAGLHFAFLDPYGLEALPFTIIEKLVKFPRMDMLIHVSAHDLQRNMDEYSRVGGVLDRFMPGWRAQVNLGQATAPLRAALFTYC